MRKFSHRLKLLLRRNKNMSFSFLYKLTMMDLGRWLFKRAHICNRCGSPDVVGYCNGLYCPACRDIMVKERIVWWAGYYAISVNT